MTPFLTATCCVLGGAVLALVSHAITSAIVSARFQRQLLEEREREASEARAERRARLVDVVCWECWGSGRRGDGGSSWTCAMCEGQRFVAVAKGSKRHTRGEA